MSELLDRRARKKAQTREQIRNIAHRLFAERGFDVVTIADVAREADVAVQTVFNHFATKEELFFDGRVAWIDGPAAAVRGRGTDAPLTALRRYLVELAGTLVGSMVTEERRCFIATIEASDTLMAHERENVFEAERRLAEALAEAWSEDTAGDRPADPATAAALTSAIWLSSVRALIVGQRSGVGPGSSQEQLSRTVEELATNLLVQLETTSEFLLTLSAPTGADTPGASDTGWPREARRVG